MIKLERSPTGIQGLDEMLEGGIPKGYSVLVAGGPGTGKSTLAMQFLYNGANKYGEPGIYISLEEKTENIKKNLSRYGWDLSKVEILSILPHKYTSMEGTKYIIPPDVDVPLEKDFLFENLFTVKQFSVDSVKRIIKHKIEKIGAKRLVLDSLTALALQWEDSFEIRQEILGISNMLEDFGCTSILTTELEEGQMGVSRFGVEEYISQGVIILYNLRRGSKRTRGIEILKMRGTRHSQNISLMEISNAGIMVYPKEDLFTNL